MEKEIKIARYRPMSYVTLAEVCANVIRNVPMPSEVFKVHVPDEFKEGEVVKVQGHDQEIII